MADTVGAATYVYANGAELPPAVVTTTPAGPARCAGVTAVSEVALATVTPVAGSPSKLTVVPVVKPVPVIVTV